MPERRYSIEVPSVTSRGYVVLDTETTGTGADSRVVEIGLVFVSPRGSIEKTFNTLLCGDGNSGSFGAKRVHHIRNSDLIGAPKFSQIAPALLRAVAGRVLFAHNAAFDLQRINHELQLARRRKIERMGCTMSLGVHLGYGKMNLKRAVEEFDLFHQIPHQALDDALATAELLQRYMKLHRDEFRQYLVAHGLSD
jgi:DNA polymerase-3 subunit epsilon